MKKHMIAVAVAAAVGGPAMAQVTVGGTLDTSYVSKTAATPRASATNFSILGTRAQSSNETETVTAVDNSFWSTSNINFKGTEDIGGGVKAFFHVEGGVSTDVGTADLANRVSQVGVSGAFGTITLGRGSTTMNDARTSGGHGLGNFANLAGGTTARPNNALNYMTPSFNGISARVTVAPGEGTGTDKDQGDYSAVSVQGKVGNLNFTVAQATEKQKRAASSGRMFVFNGSANAAAQAAGALTQSLITSLTSNATTGAFTYGTFGTGAGDIEIAPGSVLSVTQQVLATDGKIRDFIAAVGYNFGVVQVNVQHLRTKSTGDVARGNGLQVRDETVNAVSLIAPMGATTLFANYQDHDRTKNKRGSTSSLVLGAARSTDESKVMTVGASYALSKRTSAYIVHQDTDNGTQGELNGGVAGKDAKATAIGLRHSF